MEADVDEIELQSSGKVLTVGPEETILGVLREHGVGTGTLSVARTAEETMTSADPLLQPYALRHLVLRNRLISTAHEPAYTEDGLPKDRCRLYHVEKAKGGIGMTMIGGSSVVAPDSAEAFGIPGVIECGTLPLEELYFELKGASQNLGEVDHAALLAGRPQAAAPGPGRRARRRELTVKRIDG